MTKEPQKVAVATSLGQLMAHPATTVMLSRMASANLPPIKWRQQADGSWLECYLLPDGTYGNCDPVNPDSVPQSIKDNPNL
jgi:hypothetical protein